MGGRSTIPGPTARGRAGTSSAPGKGGQGERIPRGAAIPPQGTPAAPTGDTRGATGIPSPRASTTGQGRHRTVGGGAHQGGGRARAAARDTPTPRGTYATAPA